ncbi:MAG: mandelate racemase/muconate lactonizing enzyme family protein, partial [Pseudomonadota bacterium]
MKITRVETIRTDEFPNILWLEIHTDDGITGLGETFYGLDAAEGHIHSLIAPKLIGADPRNVAALTREMVGYVGFVGSSAEMRGRSAADIALWDILGQAAGLPLCDLLGGRVRKTVRAYNTCAGYSYVQTKVTQGTDNFGLDATR